MAPGIGKGDAMPVSLNTEPGSVDACPGTTVHNNSLYLYPFHPEFPRRI